MNALPTTLDETRNQFHRQLSRIPHIDANLKAMIAQTWRDVETMYSHRKSKYRIDQIPPYHDFRHVADVTLAMLRIMYGVSIERTAQWQPKDWMSGLTAALFHDIGYLVHKDEAHIGKPSGWYTPTHVNRSMDRCHEYLKSNAQSLAGDSSDIIGYTLHFESLKKHENDQVHLLGCLLATSDFTAQFADRYYLEKCRDALYQEFHECEKAGDHDKALFKSPEDLLQKTPLFFQWADKRMTHDLGNVKRHFKSGCGGKDLYHEAISKNIGHLERLIQNGKTVSTSLFRNVKDAE